MKLLMRALDTKQFLFFNSHQPKPDFTESRAFNTEQTRAIRTMRARSCDENSSGKRNLDVELTGTSKKTRVRTWYLSDASNRESDPFVPIVREKFHGPEDARPTFVLVGRAAGRCSLFLLRSIHFNYNLSLSFLFIGSFTSISARTTIGRFLGISKYIRRPCLYFSSIKETQKDFLIKIYENLPMREWAPCKHRWTYVRIKNLRIKNAFILRENILAKKRRQMFCVILDHTKL